MNYQSKPSFLFIVFSSSVAGLTVAAMVMAWTNPSGNPPIGGGALYYSGGNVGIGTSTPTTGKLVLYGGNFDITNNKIINLAAPTLAADAANRQYVLDTVGAAGGGKTPKMQTFTVNNTWTRPAGVDMVWVSMVGGGGGGSGGDNLEAGGSGGGGGQSFLRYPVAVSGDVPVTVGGAGGGGGLCASGSGGTNSVFGSLTALSGAGASAGACNGGGWGIGGKGGGGTRSGISSGGDGLGSAGGGGGSSGGDAGPWAGGTSPGGGASSFGPGGNAGSTPASGYGGGGGGAINAISSGASGKPGIVIVEWVE